VVPEKAGLVQRIRLLSDRLQTRMGHRLEMEKRQVLFLSKRVPDMRLRLSDWQLRVDDVQSSLAPRMLRLMLLKREIWKGNRVRLMVRNPRISIEQYDKGCP